MTLKFKGSVRTNAMGAVAPVGFQKYQIAHNNFENDQGEKNINFIQVYVLRPLVL